MILRKFQIVKLFIYLNYLFIFLLCFHFSRDKFSDNLFVFIFARSRKISVTARYMAHKLRAKPSARKYTTVYITETHLYLAKTQDLAIFPLFAGEFQLARKLICAKYVHMAIAQKLKGVKNRTNKVCSCFFHNL